jgi:hypothetical protein
MGTIIQIGLDWMTICDRELKILQTVIRLEEITSIGFQGSETPEDIPFRVQNHSRSQTQSQSQSQSVRVTVTSAVKCLCIEIIVAAPPQKWKWCSSDLHENLRRVRNDPRIE